MTIQPKRKQDEMNNYVIERTHNHYKDKKRNHFN